MINITIPNNNINERKYILDIIFGEFFGLNFIIRKDKDLQDWKIEFENNKSLTIKDTFFNKHPNNLDYLKFNNIPKKIEDLDLFAASFFMLSRWEEYVNKAKDNHNRFPAKESLAYKQGFLDRPIVNEYLEELKSNLLKLDSSLQFKKREYKLFLTHDVDAPLKYNSLGSCIREVIGDIVKRKNPFLAFKNIFFQVKLLMGMEKDPFDTFDLLMDISEKLGVRSYFFFMGKGLTRFDNDYDSHDGFIKELINKIKLRGHFIGIHPTYNAYNDLTQFKNEKKELRSKLNSKIVFGRGHYLRFEVPTTWQIWEDSGMEWDSTLSYADSEGFRCGVCYEYSVFNILTRKKLNLKEKPLIVMDSSFAIYQPDIKPSVMENSIINLIKEVKKYDGEFVFLWHNSSFNTTIWRKYQDVYRRVLILTN